MTETQERGTMAYLGPLDPETAAPAGQDVMEALLRGFAEIVRSATRAPRRVNVRIGLASVEVEWPDQAVEPAAAAETPADDGPPDAGHRVRAPLVGTFYRAPQPGAPPFVEVGDLVEAGRQVAIIEAMKLMNPITADRAGRVVEVLIGDGEPVEYGQPLLVLEPVG
ncbi:acetyl-CoA carboxylase biotin carboxyl carrier protein [Actinosynnema sp. CS-041913]|uniref:acetyl-CoA carboxylase biotin carboxyl carrier protein n=1 Tax=Actinosynnema sp. CS-041913 TaxID=3239917 RepID=UPI003D900972